MNFDGTVYPYGSHREVVYGRRGMVCTSQHLAAQSGLDMLKRGGNAVDAALATAICLTVWNRPAMVWGAMLLPSFGWMESCTVSMAVVGLRQP